MRLLAFWSLFAVLTVVCASGPVTAPADAPRADKKPVRLEKHEHVRIDDYFWLHKRDNPKVIDHLKGENDYLERALAPVASLRAQLFEEMKARKKENDETVPYCDNGYFYAVRMKAALQYPIYLRRKGTPTGPEEILLDVNEVAKGQSYTSCSYPKVSDDTHFVIVSVQPVKTSIMPPLAMPSRGQACETGPLPPPGGGLRGGEVGQTMALLWLQRGPHRPHTLDTARTVRALRAPAALPLWHPRPARPRRRGRGGAIRPPPRPLPPAPGAADGQGAPGPWRLGRSARRWA